ncbi:hypothetical protein DPMN_150078 [Dreissena polymorpha]|uniref:Uncharacterized protein n=1 Tax=Dreissena polymorpha TaxID=45954 RepID=A0A9D4FCL5_DREPO|nr:hypothetical protein DPMN_150078 [Dreissena polymorpha]
MHRLVASELKEPCGKEFSSFRIREDIANRVPAEYFLQKFFAANSEDPDETPSHAASHLGLRCLPMPF